MNKITIGVSGVFKCPRATAATVLALRLGDVRDEDRLGAGGGESPFGELEAGMAI